MNRLILACLLLRLSTLQAAAQCSRAKMVNDYNSIYMASGVTAAQLAWTGNVTTCTPGTISVLAQTRTLQCVNYFRQLAGLPGNITFDTALNRKCQEAAVMMEANGTASHNPPSTWTCYTADAALACAKSNLAWGTFASASVTDYMDDYGTTNTTAGHRRWVLYSKAGTFGHGATAGFDALWVVGPQTTAPSVNFIAYPPPGFFPAPLVPTSNRWSFGKPGADFANASVEMRDATGKLMTTTREMLSNGIGDNTLVWQAPGVITTSSFDQKYSVTVKNVLVNGAGTNFTYDVKICQPVHPPACPAGFKWSDSKCDCVAASSVAPEVAVVQLSAGSPFSEILQLSFRSLRDEQLKVTVYNILGRVVVTESVPVSGGVNNRLIIHSGNWAAGTYIVAVIDEAGTKELKRVMKF